MHDNTVRAYFFRRAVHKLKKITRRMLTTDRRSFSRARNPTGNAALSYVQDISIYVYPYYINSTSILSL